MNYNEFAEKVKAKHPEYSDLDNKTLAEKMVAKYPQYNDVSFEDATPQQPSTVDRVKQVAGIVEQASPIGVLKTTNSLVKQGADYAGEKAAEFLGGKGVNPNLAAGVGTAIQMAPDIASAYAAGPIANPAAGIKATGPFTAGLKDATTALPGALKQAGKGLGEAKTAARASEDLNEASRLRSMLLRGKQGIVKVAEEGKKAVENGVDSSVTHLLAYREALGKAQKLGGSFANDYKQAFDKATKSLAEKAPDLMAALQKYNLVSLAKEGAEFSMPFLETAINPAVGAVKAGYKLSQMAPVRNAAGAATNMALRTVPPTANVVNTAYDKVFNRKKKKGE